MERAQSSVLHSRVMCVCQKKSVLCNPAGRNFVISSVEATPAGFEPGTAALTNLEAVPVRSRGELGGWQSILKWRCSSAPCRAARAACRSQ